MTQPFLPSALARAVGHSLRQRVHSRGSLGRSAVSVHSVRSLEALGRAGGEKGRLGADTEDSWAAEMFVFVEDADSAKRGGVRAGDGDSARGCSRRRSAFPKTRRQDRAAAFGGYGFAIDYARWDAEVPHYQGVEMGGRVVSSGVDVVVGGQAVRVGGASVLVTRGPYPRDKKAGRILRPGFYCDSR